MRGRRFAGGSAVFLCSAAAFAQPSVNHPATTPNQALVSRYCAGCHNAKLTSGGLDLGKLDLQQPEKHPEIAEKVIRKLRAGLMPPAGIPRPDAATTKAFAVSLENSVDRAATAHPNPGHPPLHRLNRTEYANAIRQLLTVEVDVSSMLPADDMSHGFDNMADVLTMSPALMEGYIRAAGKIAREAVGDPGAQALTFTYSIPRVVSQVRHVDGTPLGTRGGMAMVHDFPADGEYTFKVGFYYSPTGPLFGMNQGKGQQIEIAINGERVALLDISPGMTLAKDGIKTPPVHVKAGPQRVSASFPQKTDGPIEDEYRMVEQSLVDVSVGALPGMTTLPHLHELSITGPTGITGVSDTPARRKLFTCRPAPGADEVPCARTIIAGLAHQAFRRPVTENDIEGLLSFFQAGRNNGNFDSGIRTAVQAVIASPEFVFRFERTPAGIPPGANYRISDLELASRISFFLWSSPPDAELLAAAEHGRLRDAAVLAAQVKRMLRDPRSEALVTNFAGQWLHLQNLRIATPDLYEFPSFDRTLANSMRRETELLFANIMREDRSIVELLTADYTFVDERLATHYGIPNVLGNRFRRVAVTDPNRYGILGHGSFLTLTSTALRTSPVQRGKYVMEVLLGTPPPPAPPNVPALPENADSRTAHVVKPLPVRERLEQHRANPACASCHKMMDPIGFALENFDAVGLWRTKDSGFPIDAAGQMYDGAKLDGPASLRAALLGHSDAFIGTFTENLLAYGLGRVLESSDMPFVRTIVHRADADKDHFSSFVLGVVNSVPFQMRRAEDAEPAATVDNLPPADNNRRF